MFKEAFIQYLKHFKVLLIGFAVILIFFVFIMISKGIDDKSKAPSTNTQRLTTERVFDFADKLTDDEETRLREYIAKKEVETQSDIVIVILNQSLEFYEPEYTARYTVPITMNKHVMVFADKFWEDNKFGYDKPLPLDGTTNGGDGVILVDNLYRESDGHIHTWLGTQGKVEETFSESMIDRVLDDFYIDVDTDYYLACMMFVDSYVDRCNGVNLHLSMVLPTIIILIIVAIYAGIKGKPYKAKVTTTMTTYIEGSKPNFTVNADTFLRKNVTKVYDPPSSSSGGSSGGGGGHHSSGGGGSHGGGGHSR